VHARRAARPAVRGTRPLRSAGHGRGPGAGADHAGRVVERVIQLEGISKGYGGQTLFSDVSWRIGGRERIGLVGPNGAGKTTLCRILTGLEEPDGGGVIRPRGATTGYLPQEVGGEAGVGSVLAEVLGGFEEVWRLEREMEETADALGRSGGREPGEIDDLTRRYGELQHRFEALGGDRLPGGGGAPPRGPRVFSPEGAPTAAAGSRG